MTGKTIYRVTGIFLSLTVALLGVAVAILLYNSGQEALELFYKDSTYMDEQGRIHKSMPTDTWYGELILKGWAFGFIYVVPGLTGITASLFFIKSLTVVHLVIAVLALFAGSFLHTVGGVGLIMYRLLVVEGASRYNPWLGDCIYVRDDVELPYEFVDQRCLAGRRALLLSIASASVALLAWIFLLAEILYTGFTFHNIEKTLDKKTTECKHEVGRTHPRRRHTPPVKRQTERPDSETATLPLTEHGVTSEQSATPADYQAENQGFAADDSVLPGTSTEMVQVKLEETQVHKL